MIKGEDSKIASINMRRSRVRHAVERLEQPVGDPRSELSFWSSLFSLRKDIKEADEERRKWYVRMYGFSIAELDVFLARYTERFRAALKGRDHETKQREFEKQRKARDYRDLDSQEMRGTRWLGGPPRRK